MAFSPTYLCGVQDGWKEKISGAGLKPVQNCALHSWLQNSKLRDSRQKLFADAGGAS
jgi:hypothetical protein